MTQHTQTHLLPAVEKILTKSDEDRIWYINKEKWIGYPQAKEILQKLDELLIYPRKARMPSMLIVGGTNNGKTSLIKRFLSQNPSIQSEEWQETTQIPVISVQAPIAPNVSDLYSAILQYLTKIQIRWQRRNSKSNTILGYVN